MCILLSFSLFNRVQRYPLIWFMELYVGASTPSVNCFIKLCTCASSCHFLCSIMCRSRCPLIWFMELYVGASIPPVNCFIKLCTCASSCLLSSCLFNCVQRYLLVIWFIELYVGASIPPVIWLIKLYSGASSCHLSCNLVHCIICIVCHPAICLVT